MTMKALLQEPFTKEEFERELLIAYPERSGIQTRVLDPL